MANIRIAEDVRNAMLASLLARMNLGAGPATLKIYSGPQPDNGDDPVTGANTLLATLTFSDPAGAVAGGVLTFDAITEDSAADATDDAEWARIEDSDGNNVFDGNVGDSDAMIVFNSVEIHAGGPVRVTSFSVTLPDSISF